MSVGHFGNPGLNTAQFTFENEFLWGGDNAKLKVLRASSVVSSAARDAGNVGFETVLRPGLLLGKVTASGKLMEYDPAAADGTEVVHSILPFELVMTEDRYTSVIVSAPVKASKLFILGLALVGHGDEAATRTSAKIKLFQFDDEYI